MSLATMAVVTVAVAMLAAVSWYDKRKTRRARAPWGVWPDDDRDLAAIARYATSLSAAPASRLDDRTWDDLNMNDVFRVIDRCESRLGQQVLYARLRTAPVASHLDEFRALVTRFQSDEPVRDRARRTLGRIKGVDGHELWLLAQPGSFAQAGWHVAFPLLAIGMVALAVLTVMWPPALFLLIGATVVAIALRATAAAHLRVVAGAFRQIAPVIDAATELTDLHASTSRAITAPLADDLGALASLRRIASWAGRDPSGAASGELTAVVFEYFNLALALDGNALYFGARQLRAHATRLMGVVHAVGELDAALAVASYRAGTAGWTEPEVRTPAPARFAGLRHPLLPDAVPNTILLAPPHGVIITGSNMSGKTTFLRTLGVNVVLAQTIHTCVADAYAAPTFVVRSCIGRADDPASGKSYYLVEVESVLGLVNAAASTAPHLFLFDELFRGTNTVERIAAGEAVLMSLLASPAAGHSSPHVVIAATHDQELVNLLEGTYAAFHFTDAVGADGLAFDYQLREGPALTRNALALLRLRGAPPALVARAIARANAIDAARGGMAGA